MRRLTHDMALTQEALSDLRSSVTINQKQTAEVVSSLREDMVQCQRQTRDVLSTCQEDYMKSSQTVFDNLHQSVTALKSEMEAIKALILQSSSGHSQS